jgi:hypothetical protein
MSEKPQNPEHLLERVAALEARIEHLRWWRNPGWWAVIVSTVVCVFTIVSQTKAWKVFEHHKPGPRPTVKLIDDHADVYAKNQWSASVRVLNETPRDIVVERVVAVFGRSRDGASCGRTGNATQVLYPVAELRTGRPVNAFQQIRPGGGAPFAGGPNLNVVFAGKPCPLALAKLHSPQDRVTYTVFTDSGSQWKLTSTLFYQPRARVEGSGGGGLCLLFLPFC